LGHHLQLVLTERPDAAQDILNDLSANKRGRASIAPLEFSRNGHTTFGEPMVGRDSVEPLSNGNGQSSGEGSTESRPTNNGHSNGNGYLHPVHAAEVVQAE